jgi:predicted NBD/HSP70 family sugar kinase
MPVVVENDLNATALGFARRAEDEGHPVHSLAYIHTNGKNGFCSGAGIVCGDRILRGAAHFAGEVGFIPDFADAVFDDALWKNDRSADFAKIYAKMLATVNCVINPALLVVGGSGFRYDLSDLVSKEFSCLVDAAVRPALVFEEDSGPHYLYGLCGLAAEELFPSYRLVDKRN